MISYWYVLFVKTSYEQAVADDIGRNWRAKGLFPFVPCYDAYFKRSGHTKNEKRRLFPGYVFVESELSGTNFASLTSNYILRSKYIYRLLKYDNAEQDSLYNMRGCEREAFMKLYSKSYCIEMSKGLIEGDKTVIVSGPLVGLESLIKHINRHKSEATIALQVMGSVREVKVGLDIIRKV